MEPFKKMTEKFKYIFIGAGFANLASANYLRSKGVHDFIILEKGSLSSKRKCPGIKESSCIFCKSSCSILEGLGGCNSSYGNKLCYFPASSGVLDKQNLTDIHSTNTFLSELMFPYYDSSKNFFDQKEQKEKKAYKADILTITQFKDLVHKISKNLESYILKSEVTKVEKGNNCFFIESTNGAFQCEKLVIATGKSSPDFIQRLIKKHQIEHSLPKPDFGFRISFKKESPFGVTYQNDPKFKIQTEAGTARTFCTVNGGVSSPVRIRDTYYVDGTFDSSISDRINFAILTRNKEEFQFEDVLEWCRELLSGKNNYIITDKVSTFPSFKKDVQKVLEKLPTAEHVELGNLLLDELCEFWSGSDSEKFEYRIYGPVVENFLLKPKLSTTFESSISNLYFIGDSSGLSRGYIQALFSGVLWGIHQFKHERSKKGTFRGSRISTEFS